MRLCSFLTVLGFFVCSSLSAQVQHAFVSDLKSTPKDFLNVFTAPIEWDGWDLAIGSGVLFTSIYLYQNKDQSSDLFYFDRLNSTPTRKPQPKTYFEKTYFKAMEIDPKYGMYSLGGAYFLSGLLGQTKIRKTSLACLQSSGVSQLLAVVGSYILAERRPSYGGEMRYFQDGGRGVSGHAAFYTSFSGPLNKLLTKIEPDDSLQEKTLKYFGKGFIYGVPLLMSYGRLRNKLTWQQTVDHPVPAHHAWSVFLGAAIGYSVGEFVAARTDLQK